eukprot:CAMPEP_0184322358 /NCGR_PEP_ID=MMETSP1049-20130417/124126_1 /TAXON_ID=77928 /ORGANISM="Proteomonas sulcata, Strain CCMP704" /LENGTH=74 /DNA_ID=CAMNT_0026643465 /DNA_START=1131 /DNA_END=1352 /DNA_ORIENTATION=+
MGLETPVLVGVPGSLGFGVPGVPGSLGLLAPLGMLGLGLAPGTLGELLGLEGLRSEVLGFVDFCSTGARGVAAL